MVMLKINIVTQLLAFFTIAIVLNILNLKVLLSVFVFLMLMLSFIKTHPFYRLTKRLKWFYLAIFIIFTFNTPGEHVANWPFSISPTYEGLAAGATQVVRILAMLAALSLLLANNGQEQLISGFYFLLSPLKCFGIDIERFAARLWLTLHYVEQQEMQNKSKLLNSLEEKLSAIFNETEAENVTISLVSPQFAILDFAIIILLLFTILVLLYKGLS